MTGLLEIKRDKDFIKNILPKIDALAAEQNKTRTDVIRDILYASSNYKPRPRSPEKVNKVHIEEQQDERSMQKRRILVAVDMVYRMRFTNIFLLFQADLRETAIATCIKYCIITLEWKCQIMAL